MIVPEQAQFTPEEVARLATVSPQTIRKCIDRGLLKAIVVPGSRFRRVLRPEVIKLLKAMGHEIEDQ